MTSMRSSRLQQLFSLATYARRLYYPPEFESTPFNMPRASKPRGNARASPITKPSSKTATKSLKVVVDSLDNTPRAVCCKRCLQRYLTWTSGSPTPIRYQDDNSESTKCTYCRNYNKPCELLPPSQHSSVSTLIAIGHLIELQTQAKKVIRSIKAKSGKAKQYNDDKVATEEKHHSHYLTEAQVLIAIDQVNTSRSITLSLQVLINTYYKGTLFYDA
ncbi:hypothetical protein S40288_11758 [Stachybotrys chartarum IBT 40288]|nr:hypothetical protein S40288_11758 [Stachybotrys chartarum IBT 40288]